MEISQSIPFCRFWMATLLASSVLHSAGATAVAQIVPDDTLGAESSVVTSINSQVDQVDGGAVRGGNLFHSFEDFNIDEGRTANFINPEGIVDILSRVTGDNPSNLFGTLGVLGEANLFFLNPNGIIFGANSSLDIRGSFSASTAEEISFVDGSSFSAVDPQTNGLLSVEVPIGLQYGEAPVGDIASAGNLAVEEGETIALLGHRVEQSGQLTAPSGNIHVLGDYVEFLDQARINASGTYGGGTVLVGGAFQGSEDVYSALRTFIGTDVVIDASALETGNGGTVIIWADEIAEFRGEITGRGGEVSGDGGFVETSGKEQLIFRGDVDVGAAAGRGGTLLLDPETIIIANGSGAANDGELEDQGIRASDGGNSTFTISEAALENIGGDVSILLQANGDIIIQDLTNDGRLGFKERLGEPGSGNITFEADADGVNGGSLIMEDRANDSIVTGARDISITGSSLSLGRIDSSTQGTAVEPGTNGSISLTATAENIETRLLDASIRASSGGGNNSSGTVTLSANSGSIIIDEAEPEEGNSIAAESILIDALGDVIIEGELNARNDISDRAGRVFVGENLQPSSVEVSLISARNRSTGSGGEIRVRTLGTFSAINSTNGFVGLSTQGGSGGGDIFISADGGITVTDVITSDGIRSGNGGDITLISGNGLIDTGSAQIDASGASGGNVRFDARGDIFPSSITSYGRTGAGGSITLESAGSIVGNRAEIASITGGISNGGAVTLDAQTIELNGSRVASWTVGGRAGDTTITSDTSVTLNDSSIGSFTGSTSTLGRAGDVTVVASNGDVNVTYIRGELPSSTPTAQLLLNSIDDIPAGAGIASITGGIGNSRGSGDTGEVRISARNLVVDGTTVVPRGRRAGIATLALGNSTGNANGITVDATDSITLLGSDPNAFSPNAEDINDSASNAFAAAFETASQLNSIRVGLTTVTLGEGDAGNVSLDTERLSIRNGAAITTGNSPTVFDPSVTAIVGNGGSITIENAELVELDGKATLATATFGAGSANDITIDSEQLILRNGAVLAADTFDTGEAGDIALNVNQLTVESGSRIGSATAGNAEGGNITIGNQEAPLNSVELGGFSASDPTVRSGIFTDSLGGTNDASNITIYTRDLNMNNRSVIRATARGTTQGGDININLSSGGWLQMRNDGNPDFPTEIATSATENARGGDITINATDSIVNAVLSENSDIVADADRGEGGTVRIVDARLPPVVFREYNGVRTPESDLTAVSASGINGIVDVTADDQQEPPPSQPDIPEVEQVCPLSQAATSRDAERSTFTNIGHGGLPPNPNDTLSTPSIQVPWITLDESSDTQDADNSSSTISEAQGWERLPSGDFLLTSQASASAPVCLLSTSREG
ncbi:MAG: filamentous hemagglutinin N-terminal domain-containing protein [Cyanobacteria bacterium J06560_6]